MHAGSIDFARKMKIVEKSCCFFWRIWQVSVVARNKRQNTMRTAEQEILNQIYLNVKSCNPEFPYEEGVELTDEQIEEFEDYIQYQTNDFRCRGEKSEIKCETYSRHYECEEVACVLDNGIAVGWTYWHGGGKHGEPEAINWVDSAYFVNVKQEVQIVNTYSKKP